MSLRPGRITFLYAACAILWIAVSGEAILILDLPRVVESLKGFAFVLVTAALLYSLLSRADSELAGFQAAIRQSEDRFKYFVENASEGICIQSGSRLSYLNRAALSCFAAATAEELCGTVAIDRIHPDQRSVILEWMSSLSQSQTSPPVVSKAVRLDGSWFDIEMSGIPFEEGGQGGAILFFRDITGRVRAEEERQKLEAQYHEAQKLESIGQLAGGVAHDLNNHLTVISGYAELLLAQLPADYPLRQYIAEISDAGERSAELTAQLLAFSRKGVLKPKTLDINLVMERVVKMLPTMMGDNITIATNLTPDAGFVRADENRLDQIVMNLAANARDAMPGGGTLSIRTSYVEIDDDYEESVPGAKAGSTVRLSIADTGTGIEPGILPRIYEPFFTTKGEGRGTGLGLSTVYGIVQQFGGWITVSSTVGKGTTFDIHLPRCPVTTGGAGTAVIQDESLRGTETVLLVEDYHPLREFAAASLRQRGYTVLTASSASRGLEVFEEHRDSIHLLLTDVVMPGATGRELASQARRLRADLKVLFISGYTTAPGAERGRIDGFTLLPKPFAATELAEQVRAVLDASESKLDAEG